MARAGITYSKNMASLITKTKAEETAFQIEQIRKETASFVRSQLKKAYALANTPGEEQAIMDQFGANASKSVLFYSAFYDALQTIGETGDAKPADPQKFQPQPDGTVTFNG